MSPRAGNPVSPVTDLVGTLTRRTLGLTGRIILTGISSGLTVLEGTRKAHQTTKKYADTALQLAATTPLGKLIPGEHIDDGADEEAERILSSVSNGGPRRPTVVPDPPKQADRAEPKATPKVEAPPEPPAAETDVARELGAPGAATEVAEQAVAEAVSSDGIPTNPSRDDLPIANYDSASVPSLRARLRGLSLDELAVLREYEKAHANRLQVVTMLDNRIAKVSEESSAGAQPA